MTWRLPIALLAAVLALAGCDDGSGGRKVDREGGSTRPRAAAGVPLPTIVDPQGDVSTECAPISTQRLGFPRGSAASLCAAINADGSVATITTIGGDSFTCIDATVDDPSLTDGQYRIECTVLLASGVPEPPLCAAVNNGELEAGTSTASDLAAVPVACLDARGSSATLYRRDGTAVACRVGDDAIDCRAA